MTTGNMLKVKNIFITGANRGIGLGLVKAMLKEFEPDHLFATYRTSEKSKELFELSTLHNNLHLFQLDVVNYVKLPEIVNDLQSLVGSNGINLLINNSGILGRTYHGIRDVTREDLVEHLEINTIAPVMLTQAFLPLLEQAVKTGKADGHVLEKASIVNVSTELGSIGENRSGGSFSYRTTKAALNMASKCISLDLQQSGITTVILHPGWVKTDLGTDRAPLTVDQAVDQIVSTFKSLKAEDNGKFVRYNGTEIPW